MSCLALVVLHFGSQAVDLTGWGIVIILGAAALAGK